MYALVGGRPAVTAWLRKIVHWRVGARWYALVLLGPPALTSAAVRLAVATGATPLPGSTAPGVAVLAGQFAVVLAWVGLGEGAGLAGCALIRPPVRAPGSPRRRQITNYGWSISPSALRNGFLNTLEGRRA